MKVLVIAQDAQIRNALVTQFSIRNRQCQCVDGQWVCAQGSSLSLPSDIGIVINALSFEELQGPPGETSLQQVKQLANVCNASNRVLIQLSGSQVFDGAHTGRHRESEKVEPASSIGESLASVEQAVIAAGDNHIILRSGPLFSTEGSNILTLLIEQLSKKKVLTLSGSGSACPMHVNDLARVVSGIIDQISCQGQARGIYHYHSSDPTSRYKFAETVLAAMLKCDPELGRGIELKSIDQADNSWAHPLLHCEKILNTFGIKQLPWRSYVVQTVEQIVKQCK